ncbi:MAG: hypothetical protein ACLU38_08085 [Dysosmobacter sp.]
MTAGCAADRAGVRAGDYASGGGRHRRLLSSADLLRARRPAPCGRRP